MTKNVPNYLFLGFGENLDGNGSWKACVKYVDDQFAAYFDGESGLNRKNIIDTRVHCCLYFIPPYGHGLRQIGKAIYSIFYHPQGLL